MARKPRISIEKSPTPPINVEHFRRFIDDIVTLGPPLGGSVPTVPGASPTPKPVTAADLPPAAQAILGQRCADGDCLNDQPLCPPDPRITCQLIPADPTLENWVR